LAGEALSRWLKPVEDRDGAVQRHHPEGVPHCALVRARDHDLVVREEPDDPRGGVRAVVGDPGRGRCLVRGGRVDHRPPVAVVLAPGDASTVVADGDRGGLFRAVDLRVVLVEDDDPGAGRAGPIGRQRDPGVEVRNDLRVCLGQAVRRAWSDQPARVDLGVRHLRGSALGSGARVERNRVGDPLGGLDRLRVLAAVIRRCEQAERHHDGSHHSGDAGRDCTLAAATDDAGTSADGDQVERTVVEGVDATMHRLAELLCEGLVVHRSSSRGSV